MQMQISLAHSKLPNFLDKWSCLNIHGLPLDKRQKKHIIAKPTCVVPLALCIARPMLIQAMIS